MRRDEITRRNIQPARGSKTDPQQVSKQASIAHHITSQHITAHHSTSHHSTSLHITAQHSTSHHIIAHYCTSQHSTAHHITSHHCTSLHITAHHSTSQHHCTSQHITAHHCTSQHITLHHSTSLHLRLTGYFFMSSSSTAGGAHTMYVPLMLRSRFRCCSVAMTSSVTIEVSCARSIMDTYCDGKARSSTGVACEYR
jgi:hypothetical protein